MGSSSKLEAQIDEIQDYIDSCRPQTFSNSKIIVEKAVMEEYLIELRSAIPDEIVKYQKMITNHDEIIDRAHKKAEAIVAEANKQTNQLISEHEIVLQAQTQAEQIIADATEQAQSILDGAVKDANSIRSGAVEYTDEMLGALSVIVGDMISDSNSRYQSFINSLQIKHETVIANRKELVSSNEQQSDPGKNSFANEGNTEKESDGSEEFEIVDADYEDTDSSIPENKVASDSYKAE